MSITARFKLTRQEFVLDVDLQLPAIGVTTIFGPSGSGKTTLLRCIAGLERAPQGKLIFKNAAWQDGPTFLAPHRRPIGYVFQDANLFPHLDVAGNLDFGARRAGMPGVSARTPVIELLGIGHLLARGVQGLSGGERQRVAIARALLVRPKLLLLDEPLAALERERKREILPYLERLRDELEIPILYVTHAIDEVLRLSDHLLLLESGRVLASGAPNALALRPDLALARDHDAGVVITTTAGEYDARHHLARLVFPGGAVLTAMPPMAAGAAARVSVLARDVSIALSEATDSSILNRLPAVVVSISDAPQPGQLLVHLDAGGTPLLARISLRSREQLQLREGLRVWAQIKAVSLV